jgi:hypothetical protein
MNTAATEIGDVKAGDVVPFTPDAKTGDCMCVICTPEVYARRDALKRLDKVMEAWSDALVDSENSYTVAGDDPLFDFLHAKLHSMQAGVTDEINAEDERIFTLLGEQ